MFGERPPRATPGRPSETRKRARGSCTEPSPAGRRAEVSARRAFPQRESHGRRERSCWSDPPRRSPPCPPSHGLPGSCWSSCRCSSGPSSASSRGRWRRRACSRSRSGSLRGDPSRRRSPGAPARAGDPGPRGRHCSSLRRSSAPRSSSASCGCLADRSDPCRAGGCAASRAPSASPTGVTPMPSATSHSSSPAGARSKCCACARVPTSTSRRTIRRPNAGRTRCGGSRTSSCGSGGRSIRAAPSSSTTTPGAASCCAR